MFKDIIKRIEYDINKQTFDLLYEVWSTSLSICSQAIRFDDTEKRRTARRAFDHLRLKIEAHNPDQSGWLRAWENEDGSREGEIIRVSESAYHWRVRAGRLVPRHGQSPTVEEAFTDIENAAKELEEAMKEVWRNEERGLYGEIVRTKDDNHDWRITGERGVVLRAGSAPSEQEATAACLAAGERLIATVAAAAAAQGISQAPTKAEADRIEAEFLGPVATVEIESPQSEPVLSEEPVASVEVEVPDTAPLALVEEIEPSETESVVQ